MSETNSPPLPIPHSKNKISLDPWVYNLLCNPFARLHDEDVDFDHNGQSRQDRDEQRVMTLFGFGDGTLAKGPQAALAAISRERKTWGLKDPDRPKKGHETLIQQPMPSAEDALRGLREMKEKEKEKGKGKQARRCRIFNPF